MSATQSSIRICFCALLCLLCVGCESRPLARRSRSTLRPWRLVVNDDGDFVITKDDPDLKKFLRSRFEGTPNTQIDAYFLNIGSTDRLWEDVRELMRVDADAKARPQDAMSQWAEYGDVPPHVDRMIRKYTEVTHGAGMQIFLAMRMNDIHDAWHPKLSYPLKVSRPDLLLGKQATDRRALMNAHWSGFDWSHSEVRDHFRDFIVWAAARWDFDGVELDWFRHPLFFKLGEEQANIENINDFVRQVRAGLNRVARARGKRYLLTTRVPDTPQMALNTGFDVEQWLKEGLLDMLMIGGGYMPYGGRVKQFIDMAHRYGVHAYPCKNHFRSPEEMRSTAANFWSLGADGVYLFNWGGSYGNGPDAEKGRADCLRQMGSPKTLANLDKRFVADTGCSIPYVGHTNPPSQFPLRLVSDRAVELVVGDDPAQMSGARVTLQIKVSQMNENESVVVRVNGRQVPNGMVVRVDPATFHVRGVPESLKRGINQIQVLPGPGALGALASTVDAMELVVDYGPGQ